MTFLHKLARRLARLKARTLIAAAAVSAAAVILGCEQPRGSTEPITPTVSQLVVSPKTVTLQPDQLQDFMAVGLTSTGDTAQVDVTWSASGGSVTQKATRGGRHYGQYKTGLCGTYTVTATAHPGNKSDNASVAVTCPGTVASVVVNPGTANLAAGGTVQLTATSLDTSGNVMTGSAVSWSSGSLAVGTVDVSGLVTGIAAGSAVITATSGGKSGTSTITVSASLPAVALVTVSPAAPGVTVGQAVQLTATLQDASGNVLTGRTVTWASGNGGVATVSGGLVTGVAAGSAVVTATSEGKSGTATITVTAPGSTTPPGVVTNLVVAGTTNNAVTLSFTEVSDGAGQPASYDIRAAVGTMSWGATPSISLGTCATPVAGTAVGAKRTCTVLGLAAATGYQFQLVAFRGTLNQGAVFGGLSNVATGTTTASTAPVASVTVSPATGSVLVGSSVQLTATLKDASGTLLSGRSVVWASLSPTVATVVSASGVVTGVAAGTATITATSEGKTGSAAISVTAAQPGARVDTIFREDFESGSLNGWDDTCCGPTHTVVSGATFAYSGTHYLKINYPQGSSGGGSLSKFFMPGYTKTYVRYRFRIPGNFQGGTKLIMFRGSRTDNVWSSFGVAGTCPSGTDFFVTNVVTRDLSSLPARFYTYYPGMVREPYNNNICWGRYGDSYDPGGGGSNPASYFSPLDVSRDVWHTLEFEVQLNDPGQANGVQRFWLDGVLRGEWKNFVFRTSTVLMLNALTLESSMNETQGGSPQNQDMYVDDILVTTGRPAQ